MGTQRPPGPGIPVPRRSAMSKLSAYWKGVVAAAGAVAVLAQAVAEANKWVAPVIAGVTAVGVVAKANKPKP